MTSHRLLRTNKTKHCHQRVICCKQNETEITPVKRHSIRSKPTKRMIRKPFVKPTAPSFSSKRFIVQSAKHRLIANGFIVGDVGSSGADTELSDARSRRHARRHDATRSDTRRHRHRNTISFTVSDIGSWTYSEYVSVSYNDTSCRLRRVMFVVWELKT